MGGFDGRLMGDLYWEAILGYFEGRLLWEALMGYFSWDTSMGRLLWNTLRGDCYGRL